ncbi:TM2 domain-containing protein 2-like [Argiope bruennichi]|uniref:TM2 domain-containing protein CG11103 n=1 Tax=Argiope bruennichi TaxID=94029 RepID=A0A8T0FSC1_ARGBR|nr:TM2 domain-containing protein 2-like [Argiope bruennichi]KAF8793522.1 TM2 domain-containing protein CG11103 [Argiope bruennichi]
MTSSRLSICQQILNVYLIGQILYRFCYASNQCSAEECAESNAGRPPPHSPLVPCYTLDLEFLVCSDPLDLKGNETAREELGYGCTKYGGQKYEDVQFTSVNCTVLSGIECYGPTTFHRSGFPCIKYSGHYFLTTLLYSVLLGFLGMDRFCLGHTGTAVGKLLTLGGMGIWWIVDVVLLVTGNLTPDDGSNWVPYA